MADPDAWKPTPSIVFAEIRGERVLHQWWVNGSEGEWRRVVTVPKLLQLMPTYNESQAGTEAGFDDDSQ